MSDPHGLVKEYKIDTFYDVSLTIPQTSLLEPPVTIESCLMKWAEREFVEGARCDRLSLHSLSQTD